MKSMVYGPEAPIPTVTCGPAQSWKTQSASNLLQHALGGHLLVVQSSSGMIYNLRPSEQQLQTIAQKIGVHIQKITTLNNTVFILSE